ncbi:hypothetical protein GFB49_04285 [Epibacterium sp. SM1979]|uniref:DUF1127 domain-containing protein n=1 Tax=Tritonibacter litoralis TaxID=2662264 RepID=A0A843Y9S0_9RHOB|nr:hypothetical protein [Tritonibacter litoralis]MQQ07666.1 hypothetical protein [Tritonibacter litoralis]
MAEIIAFPAFHTPRPARPTPVGFTLYLHRFTSRRQLAHDLLHAPDSVLADAGLTRLQLQREIAKPFWRA